MKAYEIQNEKLRLISSFLANRKQCVKKNNMYSTLSQITSGIPWESTLGFIFLNMSNTD